jgi:hypothetical protein
MAGDAKEWCHNYPFMTEKDWDFYFAPMRDREQIVLELLPLESVWMVLAQLVRFCCLRKDLLHRRLDIVRVDHRVAALVAGLVVRGIYHPLMDLLP